MGGLGGVIGLLPGVGKIQKQLSQANIDERILKRQQAIISSMTREERKKPELIKASRKQRIANGSGVGVADVNKLLKQHMEMQRMMKQMKKLGQKGLMRQGLSALMPRH
jgi:signal recognition particle subunit SRP54